MKFRKILILIILVLLCGCSNEYTLKISNDKFKENINITIPKSMIPVLTQEQIDAGIEIDDQVTPFVEGKTASLITNDKFYKKKSIEYDDYFNVQMDYTYNENEFKDANSINLCFEYPELDFSESYYINLQGSFYCLYADSVDIKIETSNKVHFNNADEIQGNTYIWHIDESNSDYVDIKIEVDKGISTSTIFLIIVSCILIIAVAFVGYKFYIRNKEKNTI